MEWVAFAFPGDLPNPGIEPMSPALAVRFFTTGLPGKPSSYEKTKVLGEKLACYSANGSKRTGYTIFGAYSIVLYITLTGSIFL